MNEFIAILRESLLGDETLDPNRAKETRRVAGQRFDRRMNTVRIMGFLGIGFMGVVAAVAMYFFVTADPETSLKTLLLYLTVFMVAFTAIGMIKLWFAMMQNHTVLLKEMKNLQITMYETLAPDEEERD